MDRERLSEIRAREQAATPGPWVWSDDPAWRHARSPDGEYVLGKGWRRHGDIGLRAADDVEVIDANPSGDEYGDAIDPSGPDADFIAHARADISYLLNLLDAQAAELAAMRARAVQVVDWGGPGNDVAEWECHFCWQSWYGEMAQGPQIEHEADCPLAAPAPERGQAILAAATTALAKLEYLWEAYSHAARLRDAIDALRRALGRETRSEEAG